VDLLSRRIGALFGVFFLLLLLAAVRTVYLGTLRSGTLRHVAQDQQQTREVLPAQRGAILDRNGVDLAISEPAQDISATPYLVRDPLQVAERLAPLVGVSQQTLLAKLSGRTGFVYLARALPASRSQAVLALKIAGIAGAPVMRRVYPRGALAAQVLGRVGTEGGGLGGIEYSRNSALRGRAGELRIVRDALGHPISITTTHRELPGASLRLTLDAQVQQRSEDVLAAVGSDFRPKDATAIVMDPRTGAVLAMADWPKASTRALTPSTLQNEAVSFDYEPGSTFKSVTISGALQDGRISPDTTFAIPNQIQVADRTIHDDVEHGEETLSTAEILSHSSNIGAIKIAMREGPTRFDQWARAFGFGRPTGIDLPGEEAGELLAPERYSGSSMGNLPIGQGELVTPIQMAAAYSVVANGGILRQPYIVQSVDGDRVSLPAGRRVISAQTAAEVRQMLKGVLAPGGTASEVSIPGYELAGKTGTANKVDKATGQYSNTAYVASFVGFAPARNPKLLCAVIVDEPAEGSIYGGAVAAPAFGQIMSFALQYLAIPPR
jgi:cell division protein FtsI (penicillin-binding protein 3)